MIRFNNVSKQFRSVYALKNIQLEITKPAIVGLVGRNGAGKTTLLHLISGSWQPTSGHIEVFNERPFDNLTVSGNCILIDEKIIFPEGLTLGELLEVSNRFYPNWDQALAKRLLEHFELPERAYVHELSKGKKSTFKAIIGIAARAALTLFDEATSGMDRSVRQDFYRALFKDYLNHPRIIIFSSHHIEEIEHLLEEVIIVDKGSLLLHLPIDAAREYAIGVKGEKQILREWLKDKEVFYEEEFGLDDYFAVIEKAHRLPEAEQKGFTVSAVSVADLAVYLTNKSKGVIDDVFRTTNSV